ncbi:porin family protein [Maricaulis sp. D1M11]|uniref:porin family protein n=1 Tax=Maricaulis sp. D1M11 TaxID=3076117 RepID=UPI0039B4B89C
MLRTIALSAVSAIAVAAGAQAQDWTLEAGYEYIDADIVNLNTVALRAGYDFNDYFGVEGQANFGLTDDDVNIAGTNVDISMDYAFSGFLVAQYPVTEQLNVFARAGYTYAEIDADVANITVSDDDSAAAFGVGAEYFFTERSGVRFDYTRYDFDDFDGFSLSYVHRFGG